MEILNHLVDSIDYIEGNLDSVIKVDELARIAQMSKFHYQRMFHMITGYTVNEYIRNRRITIAAQELTNEKSKVIDVAFKYGYETPEAFSKAFRRIHGISPSAAKKEAQSLKAYPKLSFQIQIKGDVEMDYKIVEKEAFQLVGKGIKTSTRNGANRREIPAFWQEAGESGLVHEFDKRAGRLGVIGACLEFDMEQESMTYFIGVEKSNESFPSDWEEKSVPQASWAVFPIHGPMPTAIQKGWDRIFSEWLPSTGYELAEGPELEVYVSDEDPNGDDYYSEVWVPIKK
ncbi:AraC family transcriptional regulator [Oceanobacillus piezotolerans]|uniref:AraC family transcriptional regulator n=1 Tax=Oceanobacillus piezotolerans TaxID=2448030 RepID=A0A498D3L2_9BACI|nr:AraC family transcriptional regulator [Oceanobacillus piezotolerans]RLL42050.1 AraC family transcriptional regulator [Oceanobacillus piezotolerans]